MSGMGADDRPFSGGFMVGHTFAFDRDRLFCTLLTYLPAGDPSIDSISEVVPAANWSEREFRDLVGIVPVGHTYPKRLVLPDGWPDGIHPLRKDVSWDHLPTEFDGGKSSNSVIRRMAASGAFGPFHPTLSAFPPLCRGRDGAGCEYRGFMAHRGIEKLAESVLSTMTSR